MEVRDLFFGLLLGTLGLLTLLILQPFLSYILAAILLAFVLRPAHRRLAPRAGARLSAFSLVALASVLTALPIGIIAGYLLGDVGSIAGGLDEMPAIGTIERAVEARTGVEADLGEEFRQASETFMETVVGSVTELVDFAIRLSLGLLLLVFLLFYLVKDGDSLVRWMKAVTPLDRGMQDELYAEAEEMTWAVLKGHVFVAFVEAIAAGAGLYVSGVPNAVFWTVVMVLLAFLPVIGVAAVWLPAVGYLLIQNDLLWAVFLFLYGSTVVALIDDYLRAFVVDQESALHPAAILVSVFGAVYVIGALGVFYGPIVLGLFKATTNVFSEYYDIPE